MCASRPRFLLLHNVGWKSILEHPQFANDLTDTQIIYLKDYDTTTIPLPKRRARRLMQDNVTPNAVDFRAFLQDAIDQL